MSIWLSTDEGSFCALAINPISAIRTTGQKIQTINGRVEHADMGTLIAERNRLEAELAEAIRSQSSVSRDFGITFSYYGRG